MKGKKKVKEAEVKKNTKRNY